MQDTDAPMRSSTLQKLLIPLAAVALWAAGGVAAAAEAPIDELRAMIDQVRVIERNLRWERYDVKQLTEANKTVANFKIKATTCITNKEAELAKVNAALAQLGEKKRGESAEVIKQRWQHESERAAIETRMADCNALALHLASLQEELDKQLKQRLEARMLLKGPDIFTVIGRVLKEPGTWLLDSGRYIKKNSWLINQAVVLDMLWMVSALLLGLGIGLWLRRAWLPAVRQRKWPKTAGGRFGASALASSLHEAPFVLASLGTAISLGILTYKIDPLPLFSALAYGFTLYFIAKLITRIFLDPVAPGQLFLDIPQPVAQPMARRLRTLFVIVLVISPLGNTTIGLSLPDFGQSLAHTIVRIILAINIVWVLWLFRYLRGVKRQAWFRNLLSLVLIVAVIADLAGYSNLSGWMFRSVFGSLVAFGLVMAAAHLVRDLLVGLEYGGTPLGRKVRRFFGLRDTEQHLSGVFWVRMLVTLGFWVLLAWLFVLIWDLSASAVQDLNHLIMEGFQIGSLKIVPSRVLLAVVTLAALIAVSSWLKGRVNHQLEKSPMERGSREAVVTVLGYSGVLVAVLIALGVAGIDFANLAIIAGALSVGIGFGLQNIVNNFVSGLILLIERPVKTGDWIVVGGTEGHVKRIRIRSTQIQTFDRADVIVPNSELIASQVTNWMLRDSTGRVRVPIGVAYGSDTQKVKEILLKIAGEHPEVITNNPGQVPVVLFMDFGNSALNFELRIFVRDIDHRLQVKSDINFAVDAAFREAGIEIPFPQQDLHVKNWPGLPKE
jgi:potassium efflux system protein